MQQALIVAIILGVIGLGLQSFLGAFPLALLAFPANVILAIVILLGSGCFCRFFPSHRLTQFLASGAAALSALIFIAAMSLILGLTLQTNELHDIPARLGIRNMTSYYPFAMSYLYLLITLSFATFKRWRWEFSFRNIGFFLNHAGLLIVLLATGLGSADELQLRAKISEGDSTTKGIAQSGKSVDLPFELTLIDFQMETYLPKLGIIDRQSGKYQPEGKPVFHDVDSSRQSFSLGGYHFQVLEYIDQEAPAMLIQKEGDQAEWLTCGNQRVPYQMLELSPSQSLVMLAPEAKAYASLVSVKHDNEQRKQLISVNHPLHIGAWSVYQSSFDATQGKASSFSVFQLTYDPWKRFTQIGFAMLILGALSLFWGTSNKKA